ncbi:MAG: PKD domain-containing protein, partial [Pacificimonas sp.]
MHYFKNMTYALVATLLLFSACGEDDPEPVGNAPVANAGADLDARANSSVTLDGTGSSDAEGAITYAWALTTRPDGSSASINNATQATATFTPDVAGTYVATLTVTDTDSNNASDVATITVTEASGDPPVAVIVDQESRAISEDNGNNTVTVGTSYALDGSGSSDPDTDSDDLTFAWEVASAPAGSSTARVTAVSGSPDEAVFVPDVIGDFTVRLTVTDPEGNVDTNEVDIESNANPVVIDRSITETTVWKNVFTNPALPDYFVKADIDVTAQLTVAPGVTVMFEPNRGLSIEGNSGALVAVGKADSLVIFTAQDTLNGWDGIVFFTNNAQNEFNYADVSYGGQLDFRFGVLAANIGVDNNGGVKVSNSTVSNSFNYGIYLENGATLRASGNNTLSDNDNNPIALSISQVGSLDEASVYSGNTDNTVEIFASTLAQDEELVVPALSNGTAYFVSGRLDIDSGIKAQPGSSFEFNTNAFVEVASTNGYFSAEGTANDSIVFTARNPADGWGGFSFYTSNNSNSF